jgi:Tol biopolymer transport system component
MKNGIYLFIFLLSATLITSQANADALGGSKIQILKVKNLMMSGDYYAALKIIRELEKTDSSNVELMFLSGKCNFLLKNYDDAVNRLEKSALQASDEFPEKYYYLGRALQVSGKLQQAADAYEKYLAKENEKTDERIEAEAFKKQCILAQDAIKNPKNVRIINLGEAINSEYPEYSASVAADGNTLIFTSRRPECKGKKQDPEDGKFYEDIFISQRDSMSGKWLPAEPIDGPINTEGHDASMSLSPDGKQIYVYKNTGMRGSGDILMSKLSKTGKWGEAKPVEGDINTSYFESSACVSPDGKTLFFVSEREKGGFGMGDIYMSKREGKNEWGKAVNLGPNINNEYDQIGVFVHPDGKTLYFASNSPDAIGGYDLFKSTLENGVWSTPENLGYPINTFGDERFFCMSTDGKRAWMSSDREGTSGELDIWEIDFSELKKEVVAQPEIKAPIVPKGPALSIFSGKIVDSRAAESVETGIVITERESGKEYAGQSDENGQYFFTLEGNKNYTARITKEGYLNYSYDFFLKAQDEGTFKLEKVIVLEQKK